jgi:hypothetical protein
MWAKVARIWPTRGRDALSGISLAYGHSQNLRRTACRVQVSGLVASLTGYGVLSSTIPAGGTASNP